VNRVIDVPTQRRGGGWGEIEHLGVLVDHVVRHWWPERCDLAVLPRYGADLHDARLLAWLSRARWRVGFDEPDFHILKHKRMGLSGPRLLNVRLKRDGALPEVIRNLSVLESIGGNIIRDDLELWTSDDDARHAESLVGGNNGDPLIAICPSGRYPRKRWPIARFETVIERLLTSPRAVRLVLIGGPGDRLLVRTLLERFGAHLLDLTGTLTLRQTAAVLGHCALYLGCDTGPMHLAAAAGASVVEISCHPLEGDPSGEYSPLRFGPWKTPAIVLQPRAVSPCTSTCSADEAHCILGISVDDVMDAANRLLETPRTSRPL
jgi:ADP-heptose:LPS heptosyltransferase